MNKRTDEYGCSTFENRCRFANELLNAVRDAVGSEMAIEYRMSGDELTEGGVGLDEAVLFAKTIQKKIDLLHISAGNIYNPTSLSYAMQPAYLPMATNVRFARAHEKVSWIYPSHRWVSFNLDLAEGALRNGKADMIAMIRQFITDRTASTKQGAARANEIRPASGVWSHGR
jgi:2,4-dienoyl-CoA reductase-like NADH-dependent reductase (Old Yellow Enzyme family)